MSNLICKDCRGTDVTEYPPGIFGEPRHRCNSCGNISSTSDFVELTVFDHIISSPEALAEAVVYPDWADYMGGDCWTSPFVGRYHTKEEAISATVKTLKEVKDE